MHADCISQNSSSAIMSKDFVLQKIQAVTTVKINNNTLYQI